MSNTQKQISIINIFICVLAYAEIGLLSGCLFEKKNIGVVLLINAVHIIAGMICRYFLEFGEVSNTYNFTLTNIAVHIAAILIELLKCFHSITTISKANKEYYIKAELMASLSLSKSLIIKKS